MKAQAQELIWFVLIAMSAFSLAAFFFYQFGTRGIEVRKAVEGVVLDEAATLSLITLYSDKLPFVEKFYAEAATDAVLAGTFAKQHIKEYSLDKVFYGIAVGKLNVTEVIPPMLDKYFGDRWELIIKIPNSNYVYGHRLRNEEILYSYEFTIPVPEEKFGSIILKLGKPR